MNQKHDRHFTQNAEKQVIHKDIRTLAAVKEETGITDKKDIGNQTVCSDIPAST